MSNRGWAILNNAPFKRICPGLCPTCKHFNTQKVEDWYYCEALNKRLSNAHTTPGRCASYEAGEQRLSDELIQQLHEDAREFQAYKRTVAPAAHEGGNAPPGRGADGEGMATVQATNMIHWLRRDAMVERAAWLIVADNRNRINLTPELETKWFNRHIGRYAGFRSGKHVRDNRATACKCLWRDAIDYMESEIYDLPEARKTRKHVVS